MLTRRGRAYRLREQIFSRANRLLMPQLAPALKREALDRTFDDGTVDTPGHIKVIDKGASTTIVSFSSPAMLHAGQPTTEFEGFFRRRGTAYNLIFFRDVHRSCYHLTPTGKPTGLSFHQQELEAALAALGSTRHVAVGDSGGAAAAIYFGTRCRFDAVIAFGPSFPMRHWMSPTAQLRAYFDVPTLVKDPGAYWEHVLLAMTVGFVFYLPIGLRCGFANIFDPIATFREATPRPKLTVFYGEGSRPESRIIAPIRDLPEVTLRPLPTARHFCMVALARTGRLGPAIMELIDGPDRSAGRAAAT